MYPNFNAERARQNLTLEDIAQRVDMSVSSVSSKLNGNTSITLIEAKKFKKALDVDIPLEVLFATEVG